MNTKDKKISDRIKGALFGFAIGDALGATTEFMYDYEIKLRYGRLKDIVGGGWLDLKAGEVTDDTQMMICISDALMQTKTSGDFTWMRFGEFAKDNLMEWYYSEPKDIGGACMKGIQALIQGEELPHNKNTLGNGSLMRALPIALMGPSYEDWNTYQGRFTHNNIKCSILIQDYSRLIFANVNGITYNSNKSKAAKLLEPTGHILNTYNNAVYWNKKSKNLEDVIINAVNHGGDADTIAALAGGIAGAKYGYSSIPQRWVDTLDINVKNKLENFYLFLKKYVYKI